jgi:NAD(P)-dependent dehydrogenase (short-subunit alcohol dehydrogenase family)
MGRIAPGGQTGMGEVAAMRVDALAPGTADPPMVQAVPDPATWTRHRPPGVSPAGRSAQPVDVMMVLRSGAARYATGTTIPADRATGAAFVPPGAT